MSLQVWLPLDGNLNNQGLASCSVTAGGGVSVNGNGPRGHKCYYLNSDNIALGVAPFTALGNTWTMMLWVKVVQFKSSYDGLFCITKGTGWNDCIGMVQNGSTNVCFCLGNSGSHPNVTTLTAGKWTHLCGVYNNKAISFYVNGQQVYSGTVSTDVVFSNMTQANLNSWHSSYKGQHYESDVRLYNTALTAEEVVLAMSGDLYCHYPLNGQPQSTQTTEFDISGNNNNIIASTNLGAFIKNSLPNPIRYANYYNFEGTHYLKKTDFGYAGNIWSASIWYYATGLSSGYNCIMCLSSNDGGDNYKKMCASPNTAGNIWCKIENQSISSGAPLIQNAWTHLVLTSDGTTGKIYQNGVQTSSVSLSGTISGATCLGIGCRQANANFTSAGVPWHGGLSDFRFYTKCLNADEVLKLYQMGRLN